MKLQYEIASTGTRALVTDLRTIDAELDRAARRGAQRDGKSAQDRLRITDKAFLAEQRAIAKRELEEQKARQKSVRDEEKTARAKERIEEKSLRYRQQLQNRHFNEVARQHQREERLAERTARNQQRLMQRATEKAARDYKRGAASVIGGATRTVTGVGRTVMGAAGLGGGLAIGNAIHDYAGQAKSASILANAAGKPGEKGLLLEEAQHVKGYTGDETLGALGAFTEKTGDLEAARNLIQDIGKLSLATGGDFTEMGEAAGQVFNVIRDSIDDPLERLKAVQEVMESLAAQGSLGAVEIRDLATELAGLGAATRKYEGDPVELLKTMGAMSQATVARGGAPSAAEATTAITRFGADLTKKPAQKALGKLGIDVFSDKSNQKLKDPRAIMADILGKTGGDLTKLEEIFNAESIKALSGFSPLYLDAEKQQKGSGKKALYDEFERYSGAKVDLEEGYKSRLEDPDVQYMEAMKEFNYALGKELLPTLTKAIPAFQEFIPQLSEAAKTLVGFINWASDHPVAGLGTLIGAAVVKEIAASGINKGISVAFEKLLEVALGNVVGKNLPLPDVAGAGSKAGGAKGLLLGASRLLVNPLTIAAGAGIGLSMMADAMGQRDSEEWDAANKPAWDAHALKVRQEREAEQDRAILRRQENAPAAQELFQKLRDEARERRASAEGGNSGGSGQGTLKTEISDASMNRLASVVASAITESAPGDTSHRSESILRRK